MITRKDISYIRGDLARGVSVLEGTQDKFLPHAEERKVSIKFVT